jgi:hypothetical protein
LLASRSMAAGQRKHVHTGCLRQANGEFSVLPEHTMNVMLTVHQCFSHLRSHIPSSQA